jgi:hypothetical protein
VLKRIRKTLKNALKQRTWAVSWLPVIAVAGMFVQVVWAQAGPPFNTTVPSGIMDEFRNNGIQWTTNVWVYANTLFGILAVIEFAWSAAVMVLQKSDLQSWTGYRLRPTPARAANALGLSSQVPAQIVYLIDGSSRKIKVGNQTIYFKHAGPRALLGAGTPEGVALQAIRAFGPHHLSAAIIQQLRQNLPSDAKTGLKKLAHHAPRWMASAIDAVTA